MVLKDEGLIEHLFADVPPDAEVWIGTIQEIDVEREVIPIRFAGLDFLFLFISPHAEADHDMQVLNQMLDTLNVKNFVPVESSRLIKFARADADENHFNPKFWELPKPGQIFQFSQTLGDVMLLYVESSPEIEQFLYLPASPILARLYQRVFKKLSGKLGTPMNAILPFTGVCHAYQRAN